MLHRAPRYQAYTDIHSASCLVRLQGQHSSGISTRVCRDGEQAVDCNGEAEARGHEMSATVVEGPFSSHDGNICIR